MSSMALPSVVTPGGQIGARVSALSSANDGNRFKAEIGVWKRGGEDFFLIWDLSSIRRDIFQEKMNFPDQQAIIE